jgi:uncharacterized protein (DUF169 family)
MPISAELLKPLIQMNFESAPVAVAFLEQPPPSLERVGRPEPAGCAYWKLAAAGAAFYTTPEDHGNCPVGAFTHGVELTPPQQQELQGLVTTMVELKYLKSEEVPAIPRRTSPLKIAAYAPLAQATFNPDVVICRGTARQIMILWEAAQAADALGSGAVMGRPACSMLPQAIAASAGVASVGCIGNRVYTELGDDELYLSIPGSRLEAVLGGLAAVLDANVELEKFHRQRAAQLSGAIPA